MAEDIVVRQIKEDLTIWRQAIADALQHGIVRWLSHIIRLKFIIGMWVCSIFGWWINTRRFPKLSDRQFWVMLLSSFFVSCVDASINQYEDYERDRDDPKKWGQPPRWFYEWGTIISTILASSISMLNGTMFAFWTMISLICQYVFSSPPFTLGMSRRLMALGSFLTMGVGFAFYGYTSACENIEFIGALKLRNLLYIVVPGVMTVGLMKINDIIDLEYDLSYTSPLQSIDKEIKMSKACWYLPIAIMSLLSHSFVAKIFYVASLGTSKKFYDAFALYETKNDIEPSRKFFWMSTLFVSVGMVTEIIYNEINRKVKGCISFCLPLKTPSLF